MNDWYAAYEQDTHRPCEHTRGGNWVGVISVLISAAIIIPIAWHAIRSGLAALMGGGQ